MRLSSSTPSAPPTPQAPAKAEESWHVELLKFWGHYSLSLSLSHSSRAASRRADDERAEREESARTDRITDRSFMARVQRQAQESKLAIKALVEAQRFERALRTAS